MFTYDIYSSLYKNKFKNIFILNWFLSVPESMPLLIGGIIVKKWQKIEKRIKKSFKLLNIYNTGFKYLLFLY